MTVLLILLAVVACFGSFTLGAVCYRWSLRESKRTYKDGFNDACRQVASW